MESKTTQQVKAADAATAIAAAIAQPATKFVVIRPERGADGKFDNVEVAIVTDGHPKPATPAAAPK